MTIETKPDSSLKTELERLKVKLAESEARYHLLAEHSPDSILIHNIDGIILFINRSSVSMFGATAPEDLIGRNAMDFVHPDDRSMVIDIIVGMLEDYKNGRSSKRVVEHKMLRYDGTVFYGEVTGAFFNYNGEPAVQTVIRDITVRKRVESELKESLQRHQALFENMLSAAAYHKVILDESGKAVDYVFLEINDAFEKYTGYKREDVIGRKATTVVSGLRDTQPDLVELYGSVALTGVGRNFELFVPVMDRWFSVSAYCPEKGFFVTTFFDVTERKRTEAHEQQVKVDLVKEVDIRTQKQLLSNKLLADEVVERKKANEKLKEADEKFRVIFESSNDAIMISDGTELVDFNDAMIRLFGCTSREELLGSHPGRWSPELQPDGRKSVEAAEYEVAQAFEKGKNLFEWTHKRANGETFPAEVLITPMRIDGHDVLHSTVRDITKRKSAEERISKNYHIQRIISSILQASLKPIPLNEMLEHFLASILSAPFFSLLKKGAIFLVDESGATLRLTTHCGLTESQLLKCSTIPVGKCLCGQAALTRTILFTGSISTEHVIHYDNMTPHGHYCVPILLGEEMLGVINIYVTAGHEKLPEEEEFFSMVANTLAGIIERKRAEEEKEKLQHQLLHAQKMEAIGTLAGGIAHDFNNVLTVVSSLSTLALTKLEPDSPLKEYIDPILYASKRGAGLIQQLLIFSQKRPCEIMSFDLNDTISSILVMMRTLIDDDISIEEELGEYVPEIEADRGRIEQVLTNLLINGSDALPQGGSIKVATECVTVTQEQASTVRDAAQGRYVRLIIEDNGHGMDNETAGHIFEPFFTTKSPSGTGLGLSVVYGILKEIGGWIEVESEPEAGTRFAVYLPVTEADKKVEAITHPERKYCPGDGLGRRILLVEDNKQVRKSTAMALGEYGYSVVEATDAEDAISRFYDEHGKFDLVLSDVVMPGMNGLEMVDLLFGIRPGIAVLFYSGHVGDKVQLDSIEQRGFAFLQKPYEIPALLKAVEDEIKSICD